MAGIMAIACVGYEDGSQTIVVTCACGAPFEADDEEAATALFELHAPSCDWTPPAFPGDVATGTTPRGGP